MVHSHHIQSKNTPRVIVRCCVLSEGQRVFQLNAYMPHREEHGVWLHATCCVVYNLEQQQKNTICRFSCDLCTTGQWEGLYFLT